jgi:hypothetical protein
MRVTSRGHSSASFEKVRADGGLVVRLHTNAAAEHQDAGVEPTNESDIDNGQTIAEIVAKTGIPRTSLYRHLPRRPRPPHAGDSAAAATDGPAEPTFEA